MKESFNNSIKNLKKDYLSQESTNNNIKLDQSLKGIIPGFKDFQTLQIEKVLNINKIPNKKPSLKSILERKDILFNNEYLYINSLYSSIYCYIKIKKEYDFGKLTISNKNIIVEINKKMIKAYKWSFSEISTVNAKNNSSDNELPNYIMNDTIDKILTGRNTINNTYNELPLYLLNIDLDLVTCKLIIHKEKQKFRLLLLGYKKQNSFKYLKSIKKIKFNCTNIEKSSFYHICEIINKSILLSEGYKNNLFGINFRKNYYTKPFISVLNFVKEANTGDILLFKSFSTLSKYQRCITKADYDHIALLIKIGNKLKIYDCIREDGVRLRNFTEYISMMLHLLYEKIVYRKLNISLDNIVHYIKINNHNKYENITIDNISANEIKNKFYEILNKKIEVFNQNNNNAKYDFPICKYLFKSKKTKNKRGVNRNSYFCSELVAAVYMHCKIMSKKNDPLDYLPGEFSEKGIIEFINGFHLGPETIIEFSS